MLEAIFFLLLAALGGFFCGRGYEGEKRKKFALHARPRSIVHYSESDASFIFAYSKSSEESALGWYEFCLERDTDSDLYINEPTMVFTAAAARRIEYIRSKEVSK